MTEVQNYTEEPTELMLKGLAHYHGEKTRFMILKARGEYVCEVFHTGHKEDTAIYAFGHTEKELYDNMLIVAKEYNKMLIDMGLLEREKYMRAGAGAITQNNWWSGFRVGSAIGIATTILLYMVFG